MPLLKVERATVSGRSNLMAASGYITNLAVEVGQYFTLVQPHLTRKRELKEELKQIEAKIAEHSNLRHWIAKRALQFWRFASRRRAEYLTGTSKTVNTGSGSFAWKLNSVDSLLLPKGEEAAIQEIQKLGQADELLRVTLDYEAIKAAYNAGRLGKPKTIRVERLERLVITPKDQPSITVFEDGRVELECE
ncbi:MAG: hypothetical protein KW802_01050 [Candidatus Doudnabacteria bacterium]|nr:hypothetical protein [Candidatus Doudnabacteria bacterium]